MTHSGSALGQLRFFAKYHLARRVYDYPAPETELGVELLDYDSEWYARTLQRHAGRFQIDQLDEVTYRGQGRAIHRVRARGDASRRKSLLILSGVHGNEYAGLLVIPRLLEHLATSPTLFAHLDICIVTPVNPVGAQEGSRYNADGYDINRDFKRFDTREARAVRRAIDESAPDFILSLHEGPHEGCFMFANHDVDPALAGPVLGRLSDSGTRLATVDYLGRTLDTPGYAAATPGLKLAWWLWGAVLGMVSMTSYAHTRATPEITLETSWRDPAEVRLRTHFEFVLAIIDWLRGTGCAADRAVPGDQRLDTNPPSSSAST